MDERNKKIVQSSSLSKINSHHQDDSILHTMNNELAKNKSRDVFWKKPQFFDATYILTPILTPIPFLLALY